MSSSIKLRNNLETELEIVHPDNRTAKSISSTDIAVAVNTISNLPTNASNGDVVIVRDYHSGIEGGGGTFVYDSTRAKSEHNGGTVIDSTVTFPTDWTNQVSLQAWFETSNAGAGVWVRKYDGAVNVKWFGAVGSADITNQLKQIFSLQVKEIGIVGDYNYSSTIDIPISEVKINVIGKLTYTGSYGTSNPHFNITGSNVFWSGGEFDGNNDIGSIIQFSVGADDGMVQNAVFRNLESKTELGARTGDFACVVLKGLRGNVNNCSFYNIINTDTVATNDSFPRALTITGNMNTVSEVQFSSVQCGIITTGSRNRLNDIKMYGIADNGLYYGGNFNIASGLYMKDMTDEPIVFLGNGNSATDIFLDNTDTDSVMNAFGFQSATNVVLNGLTIKGVIKCANLFKNRTGNTYSSAKIYGIKGSVSSAYEAFSFGTGDSDIELHNSTIDFVKDTDYDFGGYTRSSGMFGVYNCDFTVIEAEGYSTVQTFTYFRDITSYYKNSVKYLPKSGYLRGAGWAEITNSKPMWNNTWGTTFLIDDYANKRFECFATSAPTSGTWNAGDIAWIFTPVAGGSIGYVCTTTGTFGTLSGVTGSINSGENILTVNIITGIAVGRYLLIEGVTGVKKVISIDGLLVTLDTVSDATVSSASVTYQTPILKTFGAITA